MKSHDSGENFDQPEPKIHIEITPFFEEAAAGKLVYWHEFYQTDIEKASTYPMDILVDVTFVGNEVREMTMQDFLDLYKASLHQLHIDRFAEYAAHMFKTQDAADFFARHEDNIEVAAENYVRYLSSTKIIPLSWRPKGEDRRHEQTVTA